MPAAGNALIVGRLQTRNRNVRRVAVLWDVSGQEKDINRLEPSASADCLADEDERALVARAATDPAAFGQIYERYVNRIYNYIYHRVGNPHDAEDLTARTFQRALGRIGQYVDRGVPFSAWLYRIAHNLVANWYRDRSRRKDISLDELAVSTERHSDPYGQVVLKEELEEVRSAIRRLNSERQTLMILKHAEHLSNAEIAGVLGKSEGAIKSLYHRTLIALRETLDIEGSSSR